MASKPRRRRTSKTDPATAYAIRVCDGRIVAGPHVRAACARHLRDLDDGATRGLTWDVSLANHAIGFFRDVLRLNGGEFEGQPYELLPWQCFVVGSLFGWLGSDGFRRFRVAYVETGKGSGKSPLAAGIGLYGLVADSEDRAEIYAAATKRDQAQILFRDAVAMVDQSPELAARIDKSGAPGKEWNLAYLATNSFFRPIASENNQSGPRPHMALLDEVHEHPDSTVVEMLRAGTKGRRQALIFMITNSGVGLNSVCRSYHDYAGKVCSGAADDDSFFGYVCGLDDGDDPFTDESCWHKANPSLGITIPLKYLREQVTQARGMPAKESIVRRLNFCQWVEAESPWISFEGWRGAQEAADPELLLNRRCWGGLDLSSRQDLTSLVLSFEPVEADPVWRLLPFFWLPAEGLAERARKDGAPYDAWARDGYLRTTPGPVIDKRAVLAEMVEISERFDLQDIAYDRWLIEELRETARHDGYSLPPLLPFGQGFRDMGPALEEFEARLVSGALKHDGNPVLTMCAANAVTEIDPAGSRKPSKRRSRGRIDGIVASVMATGRSTLGAVTTAPFIGIEFV